jgi:hypothetical protein
MVCLHVYTRNPIRRGLYPEGSEIKWDSLEYWEKFWGPLEAALIKGSECRSV